MKVLYLAQPGTLQPWYDDVKNPCLGRHIVQLYDATLPLGPQLEGAQVVVDQGGSVGTPEIMKAAAEAGVQLWQILGTGLDHVDLTYLSECGLTVANTPGPFSAIALAEHSLFLMLYLLRHFPKVQQNIARGIRCDPMADELHGQTLGIVGLGASGRELARRAHAFGMQVVAIDSLPWDPETADGLMIDFIGDASRLDEILERSDIVSLHVPLLSSTEMMINRDKLRLMKPTALLINVARGGLVDEQALADALRDRWIRGAGVDVFAVEPVATNHPLLSMDNVVITNHVAGMTSGTSRRRGLAVADNIDRVSQGERPLHVVVGNAPLS
jgi:D-3-phosphoglycerate dehydrogenase